MDLVVMAVFYSSKQYFNQVQRTHNHTQYLTCLCFTVIAWIRFCNKRVTH